MEIQCEYESRKWHDKWYYGLIIKEQKIPENAESLQLAGQHQNWKCEDDVTGLVFENCQIRKVPQGFLKIFPNLQFMRIWNSDLMSLTKADLVEYTKLSGLNFNNNQLEYLPGDLFEGFENLETVSFYGNKLKVIEPNILDGLKSLKYVDFRENPRFEKFWTIHKLYAPNATLQQVRTEIADKFHENDEDVSEERQAEVEKLSEMRKEQYHDFEIVDKDPGFDEIESQQLKQVVDVDFCSVV